MHAVFILWSQGVDNSMTAAGLAARRMAVDLIASVLTAGRPFDEAGDDGGSITERMPDMAPRDRAFARLIAVTVLRRLGQIDDLLGRAIDRPLPPRLALVQHVLRAGVAQLVFLSTPAHAAIDTSVRLVSALGHGRLKGLVNAVLRRMARDGADTVAAQDAARLNTPDWLWLAWSAAYGTARTHAIAEAHLAEPPLDLTVRETPEGWAGRLDAEVLPTGSLRRPFAGRVADLPGYAAGAWWVQDAAAALPARLLGPVDGSLVADLCAAPGGKSAQLAAAGASVVAVDRSPERLERLHGNLARLGLAVRTVAADAASWRPDRPLDAALVDAPCTATGTIRRHPDVARLKTPEDVERLMAVQSRLLAHAVSLVRPGGRLVWCTCSLQPEEGERQIEQLLSAGAPVVRDPVRPGELPGLAEAATPAGDVRTLPSQWPDRGGIDGFFICRLRRTG